MGIRVPSRATQRRYGHVQIASLSCPALSAPADDATLNDFTSTTLQWSAVEAATSYEVYLWADGESEPTTPTFETSALSYEVTGLSTGTTYHWKVIADNAQIRSFGCGSRSFTTNEEIAVQLSGLSWILPCLADWTFNRCGCPLLSEDETTLIAPEGASYQVTFRIRGVVELVDFVGGTFQSGHVYLNPTGISGAQSALVNEYTLEISSPAAVYGINHGTFSGTSLTVLDEELTVTIDSGATVSLIANAKSESGVPGPSPAAMIANITNLSATDDDAGAPIVVDSQPYDGQFAQIDVISVTRLS